MDNEKIIVFDTETIGLNKRFCYDMGYIVCDRKGNILKREHFIIEQIWNNKELFETAYYAEKRPLYIGLLRGRQARLVKWGYACATLINDIKYYNVKFAYAYNSDFDIGVFDFTSEWFKTRNPLHYMGVHDIWGYTSAVIGQGLAQDYVNFTIANGFISEAGNIRNNAEVWGRFLKSDVEWNEKHMGLQDAEIEYEILRECIARGLEWEGEYKANRQISGAEFMPYKVLTVVDKEKVEHRFEYKKMTNYKSKDKIVLKG